MTKETLNKAERIIIQLDGIEGELENMKVLIDKKDLSNWRMEVRPSPSWSLITVDHGGMLTEFIKMAYSKKMEQYAKLKEEFERL